MKGTDVWMDIQQRYGAKTPKLKRFFYEAKDLTGGLLVVLRGLLCNMLFLFCTVTPGGFSSGWLNSQDRERHNCRWQQTAREQRTTQGTTVYQNNRCSITDHELTSWHVFPLSDHYHLENSNIKDCLLYYFITYSQRYIAFKWNLKEREWCTQSAHVLYAYEP